MATFHDDRTSYERERARTLKTTALLIASLALLVTTLPTVAIEPEPGPVWNTWARTDLPVAEGLEARTWMWGPAATTEPMAEPYSASPDGLRAVQYFEKSRMEISNPAGDDTSPWYVTNGLLVVEMITGMVQLGDADFEQRDAATINVAGDADDPEGISYTLLAEFLDAPSSGDGTIYTEQLHPDGTVTTDPNLDDYGIGTAVIDTVTDHSIAWPFWDFMNLSGTVFEDGAFATDQLFENPYFATGRPLTEPYWAEIKVAGTVKWVLLQAFERRVLTYTPDNPEGWQVEAGNGGLHYLDWRYGQQPEPPPQPEPPAMITIDVSGIEIDPGDTEDGVTYGLRFVGLADGDAEGAMEVSLNYTPPNPGPNVVNQIVGGTWSIVGTGGTLSGTIPEGSATWNNNVSAAAIVATFVITEASGAFAGYAGTGTYTGFLSHQTFPPRISGTLVFELE